MLQRSDQMDRGSLQCLNILIIGDTLVTKWTAAHPSIASQRLFKLADPDGMAPSTAVYHRGSCT